MDWLVGLLLLACGVVIGFFVGRFLHRKHNGAASQQQIEQTIKQVLFEQADAHIGECRQILDTIDTQSQHLRQELQHYESLLQPQEDDSAPKLNFFGDQASAYLRHQRPHKEYAPKPTGAQPQDYANDGSGLFSGSKNKQTNQS
ncbi:hypothetical protein HMF8227_02497 [Saliniradius amylolyticus]|uniref:DUF1043 family protein n=1 Tax=Saliniradius amylolyticus TaxID=2183582 RepID=A0A2S2E5S4_9ALTE|nr:DUF1043 family protein [Saliniradius amylolyticus]AWL12949.1 hypothetical protein HMF8227_02497 [Saliniradius amylolyticus]